MKDSIEKLEDINFVNEGLWDKIVNTVKSSKTPKSTQYGVFTYTEGIGWHIGQNRIHTLRNDFTLDHSPESLEWLTSSDVSFNADILYISKGKIGFAGIWNDGAFEGDEFFEGTNMSSIFRGGIFLKGHFDATWATHPFRFQEGTVTADLKTGLLGIAPIKLDTPVSNFNLLSVPVGSYVIVTTSAKRKAAFKVLKTIDEYNSDLVFMSIPDEKKITIKWADLKQNYKQTVEIVVGSPFVIPGVINVSSVSSIVVQQEFKYQPKYKIELSLADVKQVKLPYSKIFLTIDANQERKNQAEILNKKIQDGTFGAQLDFLRKDIQGSVDTGEVSDLGEYISRLDQGKLNGVSTELHSAYKNLKILNVLLHTYAEPEVKNNITKTITAFLKPKKQAPKNNNTSSSSQNTVSSANSNSGSPMSQAQKNQLLKNLNNVLGK